MSKSRMETARNLAESHGEIERIVRVMSTGEVDEDGLEPVKLLEVNPQTIAVGIQPVYFAADARSGIEYPSVIIEVTPSEYEEILAGKLKLPHGWTLDKTLFPRPAAAA